MFAALAANVLQPKVAETRANHQRDVARRKEALIGTSEFALLSEAQPAVLLARTTASRPPSLAQHNDEFASIIPATQSDAQSAPLTFDALSPLRWAEPFEALRDRSDTILGQTGARPKVLLATLGTPADFSARATFARSFFEAGGIAAIEAAASPTSLASAGAALVCLCSSDKIYAEQAEFAAKALRETGAKHIYLAGRPGDLEDKLREAGVSDFIIAGCDALAALQAAYTAMDIKP